MGFFLLTVLKGLWTLALATGWGSHTYRGGGVADDGDEGSLGPGDFFCSSVPIV